MIFFGDKIKDKWININPFLQIGIFNSLFNVQKLPI